MSGLQGLATSVLRPVLDTYMGAAVAVVGCQSQGIQRRSCEMDVLVVGGEPHPPMTLKSGEACIDIYFLSEKEALRPRDPQLGAALALMKPVRDSNLVLSTSLAANQAVFGVSARRSAQARLTACLKSLGRAGEAEAAGGLRTANYWLLSGAYDFACAWLYSQEAVPAPSHIFAQLKAASKGRPKDFEAFSLGAGLASASRRECALRLEALSLLYDMIGNRAQPAGAGGTAAAGLSFAVVKGKAEELAESMDHPAAFTFLGLEAVRALAVAARAGDRPAGKRSLEAALSDGRQRLLGDRPVKDLGLERPADEVRNALAALRARVSGLARRL